MAAQIRLLIPLGKGIVSGEYTFLTLDTTSPFDCSDGAVTTGPLTLTPLDEEVPPHNQDELADVDEFCSDWAELAEVGTIVPEGPDGPGKQGDARDPFNPWDFYDTNGDGVVTLSDDILSVINRYQTYPGGPPNPDTGLSYEARFDRGPTIGPNNWNRPGPDGVITLQDDILGVILQFGHNCVAAP